MNRSKFEDPFVIKVNITDQPEAEQPSGVQIVRATGKDDSDDGSGEDIALKKQDQKRQGA